MKKPLIGLIPLVDVERDSYWMMPPYFEALEEAGALPVMLPLTADEGALAQILEMCGGLLFTGGPDADPALYGEEKLPACGLVVPRRDEMELRLFRMALAADKPVLGICRGIQLFNVALGGTLWQDLPSQAPSAIQHEQKPPYDQPAHKVSILPGTPPCRPAGPGRGQRHQPAPSGHQGPGARAAGDGLLPRRPGRGGLDAGQTVRLGGAVAPRAHLQDQRRQPPAVCCLCGAVRLNAKRRPRLTHEQGKAGAYCMVMARPGPAPQGRGARRRRRSDGRGGPRRSAGRSAGPGRARGCRGRRAGCWPPARPG